MRVQNNNFLNYRNSENPAMINSQIAFNNTKLTDSVHIKQKDGSLPSFKGNALKTIAKIAAVFVSLSTIGMFFLEEHDKKEMIRAEQEYNEKYNVPKEESSTESREQTTERIDRSIYTERRNSRREYSTEYNYSYPCNENAQNESARRNSDH